jgi:hypothetical protein
MQRHTDVFDANGNLILSTLGIDTDAWDTLNPTWAIAIEFERTVRASDTAVLEWNNLVAIVDRGKPIRRFR